MRASLRPASPRSRPTQAARRMPTTILPLRHAPALPRASGRPAAAAAAGEHAEPASSRAWQPARGFRRRVVVTSAAAGDATAGAAPVPAGSNAWDCTFALTKAMIGAGMMPIPYAYNMLGWVAGSAMLVAVALITYWTKAVMVTGSAATGEASYSSLAGRLTGKLGAGLLQAALFGFCFGVMAVYLVVIGDILAGAPGAANGLMSEVFGLTSGPALVRNNAVLAVGAFVCAPLASLRDISKLSAFNLIGVVAVILLAATAALLGLTALITGVAHAPPAAINFASFGDSPAKVAMGLAGVVPIILNCYVGHQSVHGVMSMLQPYSTPDMKRVLASSLAMACAIFLALALGGVAAFGPGVDANILNNLSASGMAPLVGSGLAQFLSVLVRGGFLVSLLGSFAMLMFPLRTCLVELAFGRQLAEAGSGPAKAQAAAALEAKYFNLLSYGIVVSAVATAVLVPDIWAALSIVGDLASTVQAFVVPALIGLALAAGKHLSGGKAADGGADAAGGGLTRPMALLVLSMGVALFANGILQRVVA